MPDPAKKSPVTLETLSGVLAANGHAPSKVKARAALALALDLIGAALRSGDTVHLKGFGRFRVEATPARPGRNPKTGEPRPIPAGRRVKFKASERLLGGSGGAA